MLPGWEVAASVGHIRDLPKKEIGVDLEKGFSPSYHIYPDKKKVLSRLKELVKKVGKENVYLATDPDREGEAISYHLCKVLGLDLASAKRVRFDALSKTVIEKAIADPGLVDTQLVAAQESRRVIDRLVGYQVSPILWQALEAQGSLSAGRVQSVGLRLVVEREEKIEGYQPLKALELKGNFITKDQEPLVAKYIGDLPGGLGGGVVRDFLNSLARKAYEIRSIEQKEKKIGPKPPFTTASLQQSAYSRLKFSVKKTSRLAQALFEKGFVTYIRTDSVNISTEAQELIGSYIEATYGKDQVELRSFSSKAGAQEAHEAIRPLAFEGENLAELSEEEAKLYELIKARAIASQMLAKLLNLTKIRLGDQADLFESTIQVIAQPGWSRVYPELEKKKEQPELSHPLSPSDPLSLESIRAIESFKDIPKRFDEAGLVSALEKRAIGRPSTYASIIGLLFSRAYVETSSHAGKAYDRGLWVWKGGKIEVGTEKVYVGKDSGKMAPTPIGRQVLAFLRDKLPEIIAYEFTANWEDRFDQVAQGKASYLETVTDFYKPFSAWLAKIELPATKKAKDPLGQHKGKEVFVGSSKYGTYVKWGDQFFNTKLGVQEIDLPRAIEIIQTPPQKTPPLYSFGEIEVYKGKYGLFMKKGNETASVPKWELDHLKKWDDKKAKEVFAAQLAYKNKKKAS